MPQPVTALDPELLERAASVIKCLGHPLRLQLLDALEGGAATVTELRALTGATQAMVSQQLATLRGHGVVTARRDGPFVRYTIAEPKVHHILACIRGCGA
jgi:DNA-binding transcriptional ArsR family regulator